MALLKRGGCAWRCVHVSREVNQRLRTCSRAVYENLSSTHDGCELTVSPRTSLRLRRTLLQLRAVVQGIGTRSPLVPRHRSTACVHSRSCVHSRPSPVAQVRLSAKVFSARQQRPQRRRPTTSCTRASKCLMPQENVASVNWCQTRSSFVTRPVATHSAT